LLHLCICNRFCTTRYGVDNQQPTHYDIGVINIPSQEGGEDDRGCVDADAGGESALKEKEEGSESACAEVESLLQEFIGCEHVQLVKDRKEGDAQHHHGKG
jgi:hypothetical protein